MDRISDLPHPLLVVVQTIRGTHRVTHPDQVLRSRAKLITRGHLAKAGEPPRSPPQSLIQADGVPTEHVAHVVPSNVRGGPRIEDDAPIPCEILLDVGDFFL